MRPLFAIAPLALVLSLVGPSHTESDVAMAAFQSRAIAWVSTTAFSLMPVTTASASKANDTTGLTQASAAPVTGARR
jgi:hypothetical protein